MGTQFRVTVTHPLSCWFLLHVRVDLLNRRLTYRWVRLPRVLELVDINL